MKFIAIVERSLRVSRDIGAVVSFGSLGRGFESSEYRPVKPDVGVAPEEGTSA